MWTLDVDDQGKPVLLHTVEELPPFPAGALAEPVLPIPTTAPPTAIPTATSIVAPSERPRTQGADDRPSHSYSPPLRR